MALIRSAIITDASGSVGGNVYQRDKSGLHIKAAPRHVKSYSNAQRNTHGFFRRCVNAWRDNTLTQGQVTLWNQYCLRHPTSNKVGDKVYLTPQLMFYRQNLYRLRNGLAIIYDPPAD